MRPEAMLAQLPEHEQALVRRFRAVAISPKGLFSYPTGQEGLKALGYFAEPLAVLPEGVWACFCGVGNPFAVELPAPGDTILDVGCGTGVDALVAAHFAGPSGRVEGLEFSGDMLERGQENLCLAGAQTVHLQQGRAESLPFAEATFDRVISNGVYNLVPNKPLALAEAFRVLKPGGMLQVADQILEAETAPACPVSFGGAGETQSESWAR